MPRAERLLELADELRVSRRTLLRDMAFQPDLELIRSLVDNIDGWHPLTGRRPRDFARVKG